MLTIVYADGATETVTGIPVEAVHAYLWHAAVHPIREAHWTETQP